MFYRGGFTYFDTDSVNLRPKYTLYKGARGSGKLHYMRVSGKYEKMVRRHLRIRLRHPYGDPFNVTDLAILYLNAKFGNRNA